jgi:hypothetical protein
VGPEGIESHASALAEGIDAALPAWVVRCVERTAVAWAGRVEPGVEAAAAAAGARARADAGAKVRELLARDMDEQTTTPLAIVRAAVRFPTEVLRAARVPPVERDRWSQEAFPDDDYGLTPASLGDLDPALTELAITWGAAKAFEHKRRHS